MEIFNQLPGGYAKAGIKQMNGENGLEDGLYRFNEPFGLNGY